VFLIERGIHPFHLRDWLAPGSRWKIPNVFGDAAPNFDGQRIIIDAILEALIWDASNFRVEGSLAMGSSGSRTETEREKRVWRRTDLAPANLEKTQNFRSVSERRCIHRALLVFTSNYSYRREKTASCSRLLFYETCV
jgi:hypothetical protein